MDISRITIGYIEELPKNRKNDKLNRKNNEIFKNKNKKSSLQFLMVQGSLNPNIRFVGEKL